jgi:hypothetical protein
MPNFAIMNSTPSKGLYNLYYHSNVMKIKTHIFFFPLGIIMTSCAALVSFSIAAHYNNSQRIKEGNEMPYIIPQILHRIDWRNLNPSPSNKKSHIVMVV